MAKRRALLVVLLVAASCTYNLAAAASTAAPLRTFAELDDLAASRDLIVLFFSSAPASKTREAVAAVEAAAQSHAARFELVACDVALAANAKRARKAGLHRKLPRVFVATRDDGIEPYEGPLKTAAALSRHLELKSVRADPSDALRFTAVADLYDLIDTNRVAPRPVFVMFQEPWCTHCQQAAATFARGATMLKGTAHFMRAQCSADAAAKAFCRSNGISSLPTLVLFTGEEKIPYPAARPRTLPEFEAFLAEQADRFPAQIGYAAASVVAAAGDVAVEVEARGGARNAR